jgi:phage FluMu protein Com
MTITIKCAECGAELTAEEAPKSWTDYGADVTVTVAPCNDCLARADQEGYDRGLDEAGDN